MSKCYFFGCWNRSGHFLHSPSGQRLYGDTDVLFKDCGLDGGLAPKRNPRTGLLDFPYSEPEKFSTAYYTWPEQPQGQFLRHSLKNGFTAISWWDRCQGDTRGGCNSTVLLEGEHTTEEMLEALRVNFPHVLDNLNAKSILLTEVFVNGS